MPWFLSTKSQQTGFKHNKSEILIVLTNAKSRFVNTGSIKLTLNNFPAKLVQDHKLLDIYIDS